MRKGLIQIYTGEGKGKTTAAVGLTLRFIATGRPALFVQFFKKRDSGEIRMLRRFRPCCRVLNFHQGHPAFERFTEAQEREFRRKVNRDLEKAVGLLRSGRYGLVVLDEILVGLRDGSFTEAGILDLLAVKPEWTELVLTGRGASEPVIAAADLVTRMEPVKHPFAEGAKARSGVEF